MDDDDRDFRRSKRHDSDMSGGGGGGGGGVVKKITAPIGVSPVGTDAGRIALGKKRTVNSLPDPGPNASNRY